MGGKEGEKEEKKNIDLTFDCKLHALFPRSLRQPRQPVKCLLYHRDSYIMDGGIDGWTDRWTNGRADAWLDGLTDGWMDGQIDGWRTDSWMNEGW